MDSGTGVMSTEPDHQPNFPLSKLGHLSQHAHKLKERTAVAAGLGRAKLNDSKIRLQEVYSMIRGYRGGANRSPAAFGVSTPWGVDGNHGRVPRPSICMYRGFDFVGRHLSGSVRDKDGCVYDAPQRRWQGKA